MMQGSTPGSSNGLSQDNTVRIITSNGIRYEGKLYEINPIEKTIALQNVISHGSEDRRSDKFIPPTLKPIECVVFSAKDIKDLSVLSKEEMSRSTAAQKDLAPQQEAPVQEVEKQAPKQKAEAPVPTKKEKPQAEQEKKAQKPLKTETKENDNRGKVPASRQPRENIQKGQSSSNQEQRGKNQSKVEPERRFDFDQMEQNIQDLVKEKQKRKEEKEAAADDEGAESELKYDQDNFFDTITSSLTEKRERNMPSRQEENNLNKDTFGYVGNYKSRYRGNYRRGRGRGRGYNRNRNGNGNRNRYQGRGYYGNRGYRGGYNRDRDQRREEGGGRYYKPRGGSRGRGDGGYYGSHGEERREYYQRKDQ